MRTLLERNKLWSLESQKYLAELIASCPDCNASSTPPPNRRVSISSMNREFNEVVCIDHAFFGSVIVLHAMDVATRYSTGVVV